MADLDFPHLFLTTPPSASNYTTTQGGGGALKVQEITDRQGRASFVRNALNKAWQESDEKREERSSASLPTRSGTYIEFKSASGFDLKTESLDLRGSGIRLLNVRREIDGDQGVEYATVFVPKGKEQTLLKKIDEYENEETKNGQPRNKALVNNIGNLREAVLESLWPDPVELMPSDKSAKWCEIWLRTDDDPQEAIEPLKAICAALEISLKEGHLEFPERAVVLAQLSKADMEELLLSSDHIAEFRLAKETAGFWTGLENAFQAEWAQELADRMTVSSTNARACVIDTGANNGHVLLAPLLADDDCHTVNPDWDTHDDDGHGTLMCGGVAFGGRLDDALSGTAPIEIPFQLESVKLIPGSGTHHDKELYGLRTRQAISRAEIQNANAERASCLAITSDDELDRGRPSSWSGAVDQLASGSEDDQRRLIIVAAGNIMNSTDWANYPDSNITKAVHDPAQAWNALTVGAFTEKVTIEDDELREIYNPIAQSGELSPFSTTSALWENKWPNKPDIVMEGGNVGIDGSRFCTEMDDLSILSTNSDPTDMVLSTIHATSAASAQATHLAAHIIAQYPEMWPETIRGLMVHSARWPEALFNQFKETGMTSKQHTAALLRAAGYGVPELDRALESAQNNLTLIAEQEIQPFRKKSGKSDYETHEMHLYELPWPKEVLQSLPGETPVVIDVTLSYFIEPGPGEIGWRDKYRYRSHGLDFNIKKPTETIEEFEKRLNKAAREKEETDAGGSSVDWTIGKNDGRSRGSVHRDWWETTAAEAAESGVIGVFPRTGWWKERHHLKKGESKSRYSLIVSVRTPTVEQDIYTPVKNMIAPEIATEITIEI